MSYEFIKPVLRWVPTTPITLARIERGWTSRTNMSPHGTALRYPAFLCDRAPYFLQLHEVLSVTLLGPIMHKVMLKPSTALLPWGVRSSWLDLSACSMPASLIRPSVHKRSSSFEVRSGVPPNQIARKYGTMQCPNCLRWSTFPSHPELCIWEAIQFWNRIIGILREEGTEEDKKHWIPHTHAYKQIRSKISRSFLPESNEIKTDMRRA
jgi:hypothetical protein